MPQTQIRKVTVYLTEEFKTPAHSYRVWNTLMAQNVCVITEFSQAGSVLCETEQKDLSFLSAHPVVASFFVHPEAEKIEEGPNVVRLRTVAKR